MKRCCWTGHFFASNVGVLPATELLCGRGETVILSIPVDALGRRRKRRQRRLRRELLRCK